MYAKLNECKIVINTGLLGGKDLLRDGKFLRCFPLETPDEVIWSCLEWANFTYELGKIDARHEIIMEDIKQSVNEINQRII